MRRSNGRGLAVFVAAVLSVCTTLAIFGAADVAGSATDAAKGLPAGVSPVALQPRISASDDPLLVRLSNTRTGRWAGAIGLGFLFIVAAAQGVATRERGRAWLHGPAASAPSRAPPRPATTLS